MELKDVFKSDVGFYVLGDSESIKNTKNESRHVVIVLNEQSDHTTTESIH